MFFFFCSVCNGGNEAEEGEERSEVTNESCSTVRVEQQSLPDNDSGAGERGNDGMEERGGDSMEEWRNEGMKEQGDESMAEYKNMTERNNDSFTNQHTRREDFGIKGRGNGRMEDQENIKTKDPENDCTLEQLYQLQRQVQCYQRRLGELEEEVTPYSQPCSQAPPRERSLGIRLALCTQNFRPKARAHVHMSSKSYLYSVQERKWCFQFQFGKYFLDHR